MRKFMYTYIYVKKYLKKANIKKYTPKNIYEES